MPSVRARRLASALFVAGLLIAPSAGAQASDGGLAPLLRDFSTDYRQAAIAHDAALAARLRVEARLLAAASDRPALSRLARLVAKTRDTLHPWPVADDVDALTRAAGASTAVAPGSARPYGAIRAALDGAVAAERAGDHRAAVARALQAYRLTGGLRHRLGPQATGLGTAFWSDAPARPGVLTALDRRSGAPALARAAGRAEDEVTVAQQTLGDVLVSRGTVVADAAVIVFREGLEAVLILAAITASFIGTRRHLRRPVLIGGVAGIGATGLTWLVAEVVMSQLGGGGQKLEAITGLLAIAVLLLVTNWFFHHVYWSQWIARFNRRRKTLERLDRVGFVSGQALALGALGLTSVYREGFETVLFIQNLEVSAGTAACLLGAGIGLAATVAVGAITFVGQRHLPYRRMLIATGALIAVVLAVMTGTTVHVLQGLGWAPSSPAGFDLPLWANSWLGLYPTWEGLVAQAGAIVVVIGSYFLAREVRVRGPQRRARRAPDVEGANLRAG